MDIVPQKPAPQCALPMTIFLSTICLVSLIVRAREAGQQSKVTKMFKEDLQYDAIVVGSGISGGWAAKELCEKGLRTLLLERGRDVKHGVDYTTAMLRPWELPNRSQFSREQIEESPIQTGHCDEGLSIFYKR